ncbi:putative adenylyltransferase/sulfurtransferase MoeZ [Phycisphaerales bacterium]|nr:putative adenylyltransferase/sulfurtransferase MoeZ [Phycisphaerales bacterium]
MADQRDNLDAGGLPVGAPFHAEFEITPRDAKAALDAGRVLLVDVRTQPEWDLVHVPGSLHIPLDQIADRHDEIEPRPGQRVVLLCHHGRRSLDAANVLRATGRPDLADSKSVAGGIELWSLSADAAVPRYERGPGVLRLRG